jgi:hypothetical protein
MLFYFKSEKNHIPAYRRNMIPDLPVFLEEYDEQTNHDREEGNTFDQSGGNNHVGTNVTDSFRLTGNRFNGATADVSNANTSANGCDPCADSGTHLSDRGQVSGCLQNNR